MKSHPPRNKASITYFNFLLTKYKGEKKTQGPNFNQCNLFCIIAIQSYTPSKQNMAFYKGN